MFSVETISPKIGSIKSQWIFQRYLNIEEPLEGQRLQFQSIFNPGDKTPSMFIYFNTYKQDYRYKCFSTGNKGDGYDLMAAMWGIPLAQAAAIIDSDYSREQKDGSRLSLPEMKDLSWKVKDFKTRTWNTNDQQYYTPYNISSAILERFLVQPLASYTLERTDGRIYTVAAEFVYGYFNRAGKLCKIYQPKVPNAKFVKATKDEDRYVQGLEQLRGYNLLLIMASLKDIEAVESLELPLDEMAPDSENKFLPDWVMDEVVSRYQYVFVMLDNDTAGHKMMQRWKNEKGIDYIIFPYEKDLADAVKTHGAAKIRSLLVNAINTHIAAQAA